MVTDEQGNKYYSAEEAWNQLGISRSTFLKKAKDAKLKRWKREGDKRAYYRVEDIEGLKNQPAKMRPFEGRPAPAIAC